MLVIVISNRPERVEANSHLWGEHQVFTSSAETVREAHRDLARHAVAEGWDETVHVIQDDVEFDLPWPTHRGDVTSYHPSARPWHTCPRAFSATAAGWETLAKVWRIDDGRPTCELWLPDHCYSTARLIKESRRG